MMERFVFLGLSALVIFLGAAMVRVGVAGKYLGRWKLVSFVEKHPETPRLYHRWITAGVGAAFVLIGVGLLVFLLNALPWTK